MKRIKIHNLGPITDADIELKEYNFFIGGQGTGKSTLAKILSIVCDYNLYFHLLGKVQTRSWGEFLNDYGIQDYMKEDSTVEYSETGMFFDEGKKKEYLLSLSVQHHDLKLEMTCDGEKLTDNKMMYILACIVAIRTQRQNVQWEGEDSSEKRETFITEALKASLYVPAERIMYASFTKLLPALNLVQDAISKNLLYFSVEYNNAKSVLERYRIPMLGVDFVHDKDDDYIVMENGERLQLKAASSGIQSAVPLLLTLEYATDKKYYYSYAVEEPECNLYPNNQIRLLDLILDLFKRVHSCLTITTHSPYIINYLNVLIRRFYRGKKNGLDPNCLTVHYMNDSGEAVDLMSMDNQTQEMVVNTVDLSEVMGNIYSEYVSLK